MNQPVHALFQDPGDGCPALPPVRHDTVAPPPPPDADPPSVVSTRGPRPRSLSVLLAALLALLMSTWTLQSSVAAAAGWVWPVLPRPAVERSFEAPARPWLSGHRGVDLAAAPGTVVRSPAAGTVSFAGVVVDREVLTIDHGGGRKSSFEPVTATVHVGEKVARGQTVARVAEPGHGPRGAAVHWGVRENEDYVNPLQFVVDLRPSVLLPVPGR